MGEHLRSCEFYKAKLPEQPFSLHPQEISEEVLEKLRDMYPNLSIPIAGLTKFVPAESAEINDGNVDFLSSDETKDVTVSEM